ncbi:MAG: thymidine phosphorylase [Propionibacteriaceae bacterium]|jgi:thymidine phosphorylase|nr:thymidine phosphorylase [Propionibacteriaceae bacterium]
MTEPFDVVDIIIDKRDGHRLTPSQIDWVIEAYTNSRIAEEQMSALLMAIFLRGLERDELNRWTGAMIASGERLNYAGIAKVMVDKHSTGGVGDKITLPLTPLIASFGLGVPQLSGRGLGHTGGTLDKLESIPGWRAALTNTEMMRQLETVGAVICQAGSGLAPADRKLYALRDVTGTVASIPLIASSIMSKKIAEGTAGLVLDVKSGSGAFMTELDRARELAQTMVEIGADHGVHTTALITDMSTPLGLTIGNALEVRESVEVLAGGGPADVVELTVQLAREMLDSAARIVEREGIPAAGIRPASAEAMQQAGRLREADPREALQNGQAMDSWRAMIAAQGGDPEAELAWARHTEVISSPESGYLTGLDALKVGVAAWRLGAGRARREDAVQAGAGIVLHAKPGDFLTGGQPLMTLHSDTPTCFERAHQALVGAWSFASQPFPPTPVVRARITM